MIFKRNKSTRVIRRVLRKISEHRNVFSNMYNVPEKAMNYYILSGMWMKCVIDAMINPEEDYDLFKCVSGARRTIFLAFDEYFSNNEKNSSL